MKRSTVKRAEAAIGYVVLFLGLVGVLVCLALQPVVTAIGLVGWLLWRKLR